MEKIGRSVFRVDFNPFCRELVEWFLEQLRAVPLFLYYVSLNDLMNTFGAILFARFRTRFSHSVTGIVTYDVSCIAFLFSCLVASPIKTVGIYSFLFSARGWWVLMSGGVAEGDVKQRWADPRIFRSGSAPAPKPRSKRSKKMFWDWAGGVHGSHTCQY